MARVLYTKEQKAEAMHLLVNKGWSLDDVAEQIGCSVASLQVWKKDYKDGKIKITDMDNGKEEETPSVLQRQAVPSAPPCRKPNVSFDDFVNRYWQTKSVSDMMDVPKTIDETVKFVNDVLEYAYDRLTD